MPKLPKSRVEAGHPDLPTLARVRDAICTLAGGEAALREALPTLIRDAIEFVIDPVRTARTRVRDLDNVEKTFIGLKVEHYFRDLLDVPRGVRDLEIDGLAVDVKNSVNMAWMIPPESYRNADPCVLIATAEDEGRCWLGVMLAREAYLNRPNRDQKRSVSRVGRENVLWIIEGQPMPASRWEGIDMVRFRELRRVQGGAKRAAAFFRENLRRPIPREIVQALLFDQDDYMKRLRGNGGARDILQGEGIELLSGRYEHARFAELGVPLVALDEMIAVRVAPPTHDP